MGEGRGACGVGGFEACWDGGMADILMRCFAWDDDGVGIARRRFVR